MYRHNTLMGAVAKGLTATLLLLSSLSVRADEGMWLLNAPPLAALKKNHGFDATPAWLEHVQKSAVRFNNGGSGSFVSADGLIITNHHVASDAIYKLSSEKANYLRDGFQAREKSQELKCVDLELNVLQSIENVTDRLNAAVTPQMNAAEAAAARKKAKAEIEKDSLAATGLRSDVVTLFQGGEYHLYRYKVYTDVRLVFAPEQQAAFFGGDPDNFEFPRFNLDVTFFRAYENGQPVRVEHFLRFNPKGPGENDLVFVAGHPGSTRRSLTVAELEYLRDVAVPRTNAYLKRNEVMLTSWGARSQENSRRAHDELFSIQNSRKVYDGRIAALLDPSLLEAKRASEDALKRFAADRPDLADAKPAWDQIARAQEVLALNAVRNNLLESYNLNSSLFRTARQIVRAVDERSKPSGERLREFRDSNKTSLELALFSEEPVYTDLEILKLTQFLTYMAQELGVNDPTVKVVLAGKGPAARASELINGTKLADVAVRKALYAKTPAELATESDPMIVLARLIDGPARAVRAIVEEQGEIKEQAHAKIARVRYAKDGASVFPDATFTLRLSYGLVKSYQENGQTVPAFSTMGGTFARSEAQGGREPFDLPASWVAAKSRMALDTPYNFVSTADIIGGNSGSPTINRAGEFIGIIFDGNLYSLIGDYAYSDVQSRAISVDSRAIAEALRSVYQADGLLAELLAKR